ncbi:MAG TPA: hypothetical protein VHO69_10950 [Phototrophicaceae bacterium]|nr:hypothetical protein [Phototrophicaceae bacterium]
MKSFVMLLLLLGLAACGTTPTPEAANLPTLAALPTLTATTTPPPVTPSATPTPTLTVSATLTLTATVTPSATITETATPTASNTPLPTETFEPTSDNQGIIALAMTAAKATILPQSPETATAVAGFSVAPTLSGTSGPVICQYPPPGGFGPIYSSDPTLAAQLGCPTPVGQAPVTAALSSAVQNFERGQMVWMQPNIIYALFAAGRFQRYDDTYNTSTDPASGGETAPAGLIEPVRGFGKVWRSFPEVRTGLGWARDAEAGDSATVLTFERGQMIALAQHSQILILVYDAGSVTTGSWRSVPGSF